LGINRTPRFTIHCFLCSFLFVVLLPNMRPAAAQSQVPTLRVEVDLQPVEVQVKDSRGNDVLGLSANDFTILENGRPQKIAFFDSGHGPVSLVVLLDSSNSMSSGGNLGSAKAIAAQFMRTARPGDEISAMDFTDQLGPFEHLTSEQLQNPSDISLAPAPSNGSALYDAIASALCHLRSSKNPRQAIIVVSDGVDQHSRLTLDQLVDLVRSSRAQLFMIGLQSRSDFHFQEHAEPKVTLISGHDIDNPVVVFERLMKESGAQSFIPNSERSLNEALTAVSNMLQSEYTLAYYPQKSARNGPRKIEVKVDRRGLHISGNRLINSPGDAAQLFHFDQASCTVSPAFYQYPYESKLTRGPGGMIYREDFSDPHSGWPEHKDSHYVSGGYELDNLSVQAGNMAEYVVSSGNMTDSPAQMEIPTFQQNIVAAYGPWWTNFRASVNLKAAFEEIRPDQKKKLPNNARPAAGLLFRMSISGYYALLVSGSTETNKLSVELVRRDFIGDAYTELPLFPWTTVIQPSPSGTNLSVQAVGKQISISADGQEIETIQDDTYDQGYVGFVISGPGRALFSNLVVEQQ
jgi:Ca-activated chloride channel homolog